MNTSGRIDNFIGGFEVLRDDLVGAALRRSG